MIYEDELPQSPIERATMLESIMTASATDGSPGLAARSLNSEYVQNSYYCG